MNRLVRLTPLFALALVAGCDRSTETPGATRDKTSWTQHAGPQGNYTTPTTTLAASWPPEGPPTLWRRPLGNGYSGVVTDGVRLYTMWRDGDRDVVVALDPETGRDLWRHDYEEPARDGNQTEFGVGPNATPLVAGDTLITLGYSGTVLGLDSTEGTVRWTLDLVGQFDAEVLDFGHSASPILHDGRVILLVGGERAGAIALDPDDGSVVWQSRATSVSYATPLVIDAPGGETLLYFSADELIALDPADGGFRWSHPVVNQYRNNATMPLWDGQSTLWVATQQDGGTRALRLGADDAGNPTVDELWLNDRIRIHFWNAMLRDGLVYASIGGQASVLAAVELATGKIVWRERGFSQANLLQAGDKTVLLDEKGELALVGLTPEGITVHARTTLFDGTTWTVPTLVGTRLYVRDKAEILCLELG